MEFIKLPNITFKSASNRIYKIFADKKELSSKIHIDLIHDYQYFKKKLLKDKNDKAAKSVLDEFRFAHLDRMELLDKIDHEGTRKYIWSEIDKFMMNHK